MASAWADFMKVAGDSFLVAFVKRLLCLDVNQRNTVAEALNDPFLASVPTCPPDTDWDDTIPLPMSTFSQPLTPTVPLLPEMGMLEQLQQVPGMHATYWSTCIPPFGVSQTGVTHRYNLQACCCVC